MYQPLTPPTIGGEEKSQSDCRQQDGVNSMVPYGSMHVELHKYTILTTTFQLYVLYLNLNFVMLFQTETPINYYVCKVTQNTILSYRKLSHA